MNKVESETVEVYTIDDYLNGTAIINGTAIGSFYSYKFLGLSPENGTPVFDDYADRQHLLKYKSLEETVLMIMEKSGQREPKFSGNFANTFTYKNFTLTMNMAYGLGSKVRLFALYEPIVSGVSAEANVRKEFLNRWQVPGDETKTNIPAILSPADADYMHYYAHFSSSLNNATHIQKFARSTWDMYDKSNLRVVSGNYLRCNSMSLRYTFGKDILSYTPFEAIQVSLNAMNLFTLSAKELKGQDPSQSGFAKPNLSVRPSYTFQFNVTF